MSFHVNELQKIHATTKGFFRGNLRGEIGQTIGMFDQYVKQIKSASGTEREQLLKRYLEIAQGMRHAAISNGATNAKDPAWAAAAVAESWLCLLRSNNTREILDGEKIINQMRS